MEGKATKEDKLYEFFRNQIAGMTVLFEKRISMPVLILLYVTIEIIAFVRAGGDDRCAGKRFQDFANKYLVKHLSGISASDLWGTRCAFLHTGTPESSSSKKGTAREILYCWGKASIDHLHEVIRRSPDAFKYTATSFEDLFMALGNGVDDFGKDLEDDPRLYKECLKRIAKFYSYVPVPKIE
jgi:hypothetical protein